MKIRELFLVSVTHNTGHGPCNDPLMITEHLETALKAARSAESWGYEFYDPMETGVGISRLEFGRLYPKEKWKFSGNPPPDYPCVVYFRKEDGRWTEEWFDEALQERFAFR